MEAQYTVLLAQKDQELECLRDEFQSFQGTFQSEMSQNLEAELEGEIDQQAKKIEQLERQNEELRTELQKLKVSYKQKQQLSQRTESNRREDYLDKKCHEQEQSLQYYIRINRELETEIDGLWNKIREKEYEIESLREFYENTLEELAINCQELEKFKDYSQENIQRLKEQITELTHELQFAKKRTHEYHVDSEHSIERSRTNSFANLNGKNSLSMIDSIIKVLRSAPDAPNKGLSKV